MKGQYMPQTFDEWFKAQFRPSTWHVYRFAKKTDAELHDIVAEGLWAQCEVTLRIKLRNKRETALTAWLARDHKPAKKGRKK